MPQLLQIPRIPERKVLLLIRYPAVGPFVGFFPLSKTWRSLTASALTASEPPWGHAHKRHFLPQRRNLLSHLPLHKAAICRQVHRCSVAGRPPATKTSCHPSSPLLRTHMLTHSLIPHSPVNTRAHFYFLQPNPHPQPGHRHVCMLFLGRCNLTLLVLSLDRWLHSS